MVQPDMERYEAPVASPPRGTTRPASSALNAEQRLAMVVACLAFVVLLPNVQELLVKQLPFLSNNYTLLSVANAVLIGLSVFFLKEHVGSFLVF